MLRIKRGWIPRNGTVLQMWSKNILVKFEQELWLGVVIQIAIDETYHSTNLAADRTLVGISLQVF